MLTLADLPTAPVPWVLTAGSGWYWLDEYRLYRGMRYCHGELIHWRKEKRRVRKLALLNAKQRRIAR